MQLRQLETFVVASLFVECETGDAPCAVARVLATGLPAGDDVRRPREPVRSFGARVIDDRTAQVVHCVLDRSILIRDPRNAQDCENLDRVDDAGRRTREPVLAPTSVLPLVRAIAGDRRRESLLKCALVRPLPGHGGAPYRFRGFERCPA